MEIITTRELKEKLADLQGQKVTLRGWIRNHRNQKNMGFIDFFDGTCFKNPQVVYDNTIEGYNTVSALHIGSAITVVGTVVPSVVAGVFSPQPASRDRLRASTRVSTSSFFMVCSPSS